MKCKRLVFALAGLVILCIFPKNVSAETIPFLSLQDANTLPGGEVDFTMSATYFHGYVPEFPNNIDRGGEFYEIPRIGANIGVVDNVEVQVNWPVVKVNSPQYGDHWGPGDARVFTKINVLKENGDIPAFGVWFGFKAPDDNAKLGLGDKRMDLFAEGLVSKTLGPVETHLNLGLALYDNPSTNFSQDDLLAYDVGFLVPVIAHLKVGAEVVGTECSKVDNTTSLARIGIQYDIQDLTLDASVGAGLNKNTSDCVISTGFVYHLKNLWGNKASKT
jgi:hypothetical protein